MFCRHCLLCNILQLWQAASACVCIYQALYLFISILVIWCQIMWLPSQNTYILPTRSPSLFLLFYVLISTFSLSLDHPQLHYLPCFRSTAVNRIFTSALQLSDIFLFSIFFFSILAYSCLLYVSSTLFSLFPSSVVLFFVSCLPMIHWHSPGTFLHSSTGLCQAAGSLIFAFSFSLDRIHFTQTQQHLLNPLLLKINYSYLK